jgi:hypothetical protein
VWLYLFDGPCATRADMDAALAKKQAAKDLFTRS